MRLELLRREEALSPNSRDDFLSFFLPPVEDDFVQVSTLRDRSGACLSLTRPQTSNDITVGIVS